MQKTFSLTTAIALTLGFLGGIGSESLQASTNSKGDFNINGGLAGEESKKIFGLGKDLLMDIIKEMPTLKDVQEFLGLNKITKSLINHERFPSVLNSKVDCILELLEEERELGFDAEIDYEFGTNEEEVRWSKIVEISEIWGEELKEELFAAMKLGPEATHESFKKFFKLYLRQEWNYYKNSALYRYTGLGQKLNELIKNAETNGYKKELQALGFIGASNRVELLNRKLNELIEKEKKQASENERRARGFIGASDRVTTPEEKPEEKNNEEEKKKIQEQIDTINALEEKERLNNLICFFEKEKAAEIQNVLEHELYAQREKSINSLFETFFTDYLEKIKTSISQGKDEEYIRKNVYNTTKRTLKDIKERIERLREEGLEQTRVMIQKLQEYKLKQKQAQEKQDPEKQDPEKQAQEKADGNMTEMSLSHQSMDDIFLKTRIQINPGLYLPIPVIDMIKLLIDNGVSVDALDKNRKTMLIYAAERGGTAEIEQLINDYHADVTSPDCAAGITPFHVAAQNNHPETIRVLRKYGVDVNARILPIYQNDEKEGQIIQNSAFAGCTALHLAAKEDNAEAVRTLINMGAEVNAQIPLIYQNDEEEGHDEEEGRIIINHDFAGCTALHLAAKKDNAEAVRTLINMGADLTVRNHQGKTAYDVATGNSKRIILDAMNAALFQAAKVDNAEAARELIDMGADWKVRNKHGETAYNVATGSSRQIIRRAINKEREEEEEEEA